MLVNILVSLYSVFYFHYAYFWLLSIFSSLFHPDALAAKRRLDAPAKSRCHQCKQCGHRAADCPLRDRRHMRTNHVNDVDASIATLIGRFLPTNSHPVNLQVFRPGFPRPPIYNPLRGAAVGPRFSSPVHAQPLIALLPTPPHPSNPVTVRHLNKIQPAQQSYATFGRPRAPYSLQQNLGARLHPAPGYAPIRKPRAINGLHHSTPPLWSSDAAVYRNHFPPPSHLVPGVHLSPRSRSSATQSQPVRHEIPVQQSTPGKFVSE